MAGLEISRGTPWGDGALAPGVLVPTGGAGNPVATVLHIAKLLKTTAGDTFPAADADANDGALHFLTAAVNPLPNGLSYLDADGNALTAAAKFDIAQKEVVVVSNVETHRWRRLLRLADLAGFEVRYAEARLDLAAQPVTTDGTLAGVEAFSSFAENAGASADWISVAARSGGGSQAIFSEAGEYIIHYEDWFESTTNPQNDSNSRMGLQFDLRLVDSAGTVKRHLGRGMHYFRADKYNAYQGVGTGSFPVAVSIGHVSVAADDRLELRLQAWGKNSDSVDRDANTGRIWIKRQHVDAVAS